MRGRKLQATSYKLSAKAKRRRREGGKEGSGKSYPQP
jgi:hypothetical protein